MKRLVCPALRYLRIGVAQGAVREVHLGGDGRRYTAYYRERSGS